MSLLDMDPDELRNFADQLTSKADEIEQIVNTLTSQLSSVQWIGTDASRFTNDWESSHRPQLNAVSNALRDAASVATSNVAQQEQASA